jgi:hypothetical protein
MLGTTYALNDIRPCLQAHARVLLVLHAPPCIARICGVTRTPHPRIFFEPTRHIKYHFDYELSLVLCRSHPRLAL